MQIPAYLAEPSREGTFGGVVVVQEVFGVNSHIREVAERIAGAGFVAIAPHIYHRQVQGFEVGYEEADLELGRKYKKRYQSRRTPERCAGGHQLPLRQRQCRQNRRWYHRLLLRRSRRLLSRHPG